MEVATANERLLEGILDHVQSNTDAITTKVVNLRERLQRTAAPAPAPYENDKDLHDGGFVVEMNRLKDDLSSILTILSEIEEII